MRLIGTETEYGVSDPTDPHAGAIALSAAAVNAYREASRVGVDWDLSLIHI